MSRTETMTFAGDSPGTLRHLTCVRYGKPGAVPKVYLQAGLHADEMPGVLVLQYLKKVLDDAQAAGHIRGEILVVPFANPIGLAQWQQNKPQGRQDPITMQNFNCNYPDVASLVADTLATALRKTSRLSGLHFATR